jgi:hypothetical protein
MRQDLDFGQNLRSDALGRDIHDLLLDRERTLEPLQLATAVTHSEKKAPAGGVAERREGLQDRTRGTRIAPKLERLAFVPGEEPASSPLKKGSSHRATCNIDVAEYPAMCRPTLV